MRCTRATKGVTLAAVRVPTSSSRPSDGWLKVTSLIARTAMIAASSTSVERSAVLVRNRPCSVASVRVT